MAAKVAIQAERAAHVREAASGWRLPLGLQISKRSGSRTRIRCIVLSVMLMPPLVYKLVNAYPRSRPQVIDEIGEVPLNKTTWEEARQLRSVSQPGYGTGYDCLTAQEHYDSQEVSFFVVRRYMVTMGGMDGSSSSCSSGEGPCLKKGNEAYLLLYIPVMCYMFIALAVVCDEFFVPSLEMFVGHYDISMDVAGATFMAAGGSMPELFTSLIAVFDKSDVGFATIVGSAVFNVLFVIAVCALSSKEPLQLTWWPLARDCTFYIIGLALVVIFFSANSPNKIEWWEALILFGWYLIYCAFMKFNGPVHDWVERKLTARKVRPEGMPQEQLRKSVTMSMPSSFRGGIIQVLTQHANISESAGMAVVTEFKGSLQDVFAEMDADGDGHINEAEFVRFMEHLGWQPPLDEDGDIKEGRPAASELWKCMTLTKENLLHFDAFTKWYTVSEARVEIEVRRVFSSIDTNGDGRIEEEEITKLLERLGHNKPTKHELEAIMAELRRYVVLPGSNNRDGKFEVGYDAFEKWYMQSVFCKAQRKVHRAEREEMEEPGEPFSIDYPGEDASWWQVFWYVFTYPLCAAMYCTLPDVRRPEMEGKVHWAIIEFLLSLVWIAIFSLTLYECTVTCSNTIGIPPPVAAVTIIAAGTSVPDLLSSYIVARQGEGDMAVSSSIGSNIFDITVGLPIPWMLFSISRNGEPVNVKNGGIGLSVLVLMAMLSAVLFTIMLMKWKMNKAMGIVMMVLYVIFLLEDVLRQLPKDDPILKIDF